MRSPAPARLLMLVVALLALSAAPASAEKLPGAKITVKKYAQPASYPGLQRLHYEYGPIEITPGQNTIEFEPNNLKPKVDGYITRFSPNLIYAKSRKIPRVDVVHLHHGVWLMRGLPTFAAGEEKTIFNAPKGYGYRYDADDGWLMNYMLHNLTPTPTSVYITYDIDFLPASDPDAQSMTELHPLWMDVSGLKAYPVFNAPKNRKGKYTFPDDARGKARRDIGPANRFTAFRDMTLVGTAGHLHPGGLYTDLEATRNGTKKRLFRSQAKYWEPAGAVSWDVAMTATKEDWRVAIKEGDELDVSATYDTRKASWYESMGIMVVFYANGIQPEAKDPFTDGVDAKGLLTHGHLPENDNHGGSRYSGLPDPRSMLTGPPTRNVKIEDFVYGRGDLGLTGRAGRPPAVQAGKSLTFTNLDALPGVAPRQSKYHTITACKAPCNRTTGIAYPIADGARSFDSAELGYGPSFATPAANRHTWKTPKNLKPATYTYFCRVHPFMRGSFRVVPKKRSNR